MSQNDLVIANQSFPATRADINSALQALGSSNSGTTEPATTYANMFWYDTTDKVLKLRSEANDAWISVGYFDQSANAFRILDNTQVTNTSGTQTGLLGDQATATWETGTSTTESLVSPAKVKASVLANAATGTASAGTVDLPNGTEFRSGTGTTGSGGTGVAIVTFATAFSNTCLQALANHNGTGPRLCVTQGESATTFQVRTYNNNGILTNADFKYIAIGY
jgi:hypothetical protein